MSKLFCKSATRAYVMTKTPNLLTYTEATDNAAWTKTSCTSVDGATDPVSGTAAETVTATNSNATLTQSVTLEAKTYTFSIYMKRKTGTGTISISVDGSTFVTQTITGSWVRYSTTLLVSAGAKTPGVKIATNADAIYVYGAQLEEGVTASTYAKNDATRYTVAQVTDADYPANTCRGTIYLDGRVFVMTANGDIYQSADGDFTSWAATEFIGADIEPDKGVYLAKYHNYAMALKAFSVQFYYDAANSSGSVLSPVQNMAYRIGCAHADSVKEVSGTVIWLGQSRDGQGRSVYRMNGATPEALSTPSVDRILSRDDLASVKSWVAKSGSHILYGITLGTSGVTLVYDFSTQLWSFFTYLTGSGTMKVVTAISADGQVTCASHGYSESAIVQIQGAGDFDGFHIITESVDSDTFSIPASGAAFSGYAGAQSFTEEEFPVTCSTSAGGIQWMAKDGKLCVLDDQTDYDDLTSATLYYDVSNQDNILSDANEIGVSGGWSINNCTVTHDSIASPIGTMTAETVERIGLDGTFGFNCLANVQYTFSIYLKKKSGSGNITVLGGDGVGGLFTYPYTLTTTDWTRVDITMTAVDYSTAYLSIALGVLGDQVYAWGGRVDLGSAANPAYYSFDFPDDCLVSRIRTPKWDSGSSAWKFISSAEIIGDKTDTQAMVLWSDDDGLSYSDCRPVDLSLQRAKVRRLGRASRRSFEIIHCDNTPLRLEALELTIGD